MSSETDSPPHLPPELERVIFEFAFTESGPQDSTKYLLVARRVNEWLKPLIFRVFNQMTSPKFPDFERFSNSLKIEDVGRFAQRLILHRSTTEELERTLVHCPNLQDLAIWLRSIKFLLPILEKLPLKRLSADFSNLDPDDYLSSMFSNITHLDVVKFHGRTWKEWEVLSKLPQLSHLIVGFLVDLDVLCNLLQYAAHLQVLIFMPEQEDMFAWMRDYDDDQDRIFGIDDDRLVLLNSPQYPGLVEDWVKGGESGLDNWTFCELLSFARKRNFLLDNSQQWFTRVFDWDKKLNNEGKMWYSELNWQDPWSSDICRSPITV